jgi:hypothetical protein
MVPPLDSWQRQSHDGCLEAGSLEMTTDGAMHLDKFCHTCKIGGKHTAMKIASNSPL